MRCFIYIDRIACISPVITLSLYRQQSSVIVLPADPVKRWWSCSGLIVVSWGSPTSLDVFNPNFTLPKEKGIVTGVCLAFSLKSYFLNYCITLPCPPPVIVPFLGLPLSGLNYIPAARGQRLSVCLRLALVTFNAISAAPSERPHLHLKYKLIQFLFMPACFIYIKQI